MTVRTVSRYEQDQTKVIDTVNTLASGRTNATAGTTNLLTLSSTGGTSTTVSAATCGAGSGVWLSPTTASAASAVASVYVPSTGVIRGKFTVFYSSSTTTDRTFNWLIMG